MQRTLTTAGLGDKETLLIKSYLSLLSGKTREPWAFRDSGPVDACIAVPGLDAGKALTIRYGGDGELRLNAPLRVAAVIAVLDQASACLGAAKSAAAPAAATAAASVAAPAAPATRGDGRGTLAECLRSRRDDETVLRLSDGRVRVEADFVAGRYRSSAPLLAQHATAADWHRDDAPAPVTAVEGALTWLMWMAGVGEARVQPGVYRLRRWPDFGALPHRPEFVRLAALFARQATSPGAAAAAAAVPVPEVEAFLGGCLMAGYAGSEGALAAPLPRPAATLDDGVRGLLGRIRRRLGL
ncbi:hypothetical protein [Solimonas variicoloris]|uniref:hypothetical protein n=1 Tax=Solimonas variicoloris TaxID=254408 RepID=UPI0003744B69|nr:hypothetical protein [Solimonas variicoloris]